MLRDFLLADIPTNGGKAVKEH